MRVQSVQGIETTTLFPHVGRALAKDRHRGPMPTSGDSFLDAYLRRLDPDIARSFTPEQLRAIKTLFRSRGFPRQLLSLRQSFAFGRRRYFFSMHFGPERRNRSLWRNPSLGELMTGYGMAFGAVLVLLAAAYGVACLFI